MANIPAECGELSDGSCSDEITPRGKQEPFGPPGSVQGVNDYTGWFAGDAGHERHLSRLRRVRVRRGTTRWCITITSASMRWIRQALR